MENMENIITNPGLSLIAIEIFLNCGRHLKNARLVCKSWKDLIDNAPELKRTRLQLRLRAFGKARINQRFFIRWPSWKNIIKHFIKFRSNEDMEKLIEVLLNHLTLGDQIDFEPLLAATRFNDLSTFNFLIPSIENLDWISNVKGNCLHNAMYYNSGNVLVRILELNESRFHEPIPRYRWRPMKNGARRVFCSYF